MKTFKPVLIILVLLMLQSCVMKSLNPFYKKETLAYNDALIGEWTDSKKGQWKVISFKEMFEEENKDQSKISKEDKEIYEKYKEGYFISYTKSEQEAIFVAMPFKVDNDLFLDFTPFYLNDDNLNSLLSQHLVKSHSVAKLDLKETTASFSFLSEEVMKELFKDNKIKLDHTKVGLDNNLFLTASSEDLYSFLQKFNTLNLENKWRSGDIYKLKKSNVQP